MKTNFEKRIELIDSINTKITQDIKDGKADDYTKEFDKRFYGIMTMLKEQGENLWWTDGEEQFYKSLAGGE